MAGPFTSAPVIDTERLVLRAHRSEDLDVCAAMWADPGVTRFIGGRPMSREESWTRVLRYAGLWPLLGYGFWAMHDRETGRFAGDIGFHDLKRELAPSLEGEPECGWALMPWAHGKGLATEALRAVLAWADTEISTPRSVCLIAPENTPSLRVAEKCGYREFTRTTYKGSPCILLERASPAAISSSLPAAS